MVLVVFERQPNTCREVEVQKLKFGDQSAFVEGMKPIVNNVCAVTLACAVKQIKAKR